MLKTLKHDAKADFLLDKGMDVLWSKGYNGTSVSDIVKAADVPKGSFYFYFNSKEDFVVRAIEKYFKMHFTPAQLILEDKSKSPKQRLFEFHDYRSNVLKNDLDCSKGCLACNIISEMAEHSEKIRTSVIIKEEYILSVITQVIQEAQDVGEVTNKMKASDLAAFIEDAGKGAMTSMRGLKSAYPIDNFMFMVKEVLLK